MVTIYSDNGKEECTTVTIYQQKTSEYEIYKYEIDINMKYIYGVRMVNNMGTPR